MKDLVSIIVPLYKSEDYIEKCAVSLLEQTYDNIEYVFVNDCTPDRTIEILNQIVDKYPKRKQCVKIINMPENQGHANCRNIGLKYCHGIYSIQIDSDDYVDITMIEKMYDFLKDNNADMCCCDFYEMTNKGVSVVRIPDDMPSKDSVKNYKYGIEYSAHWNKLIKTSLIKDNDIYCIPNINNWVDIGQTLRLRMVAKKIVLLHEPLYYYNRTNPNSVSKTLTKKRGEQMLLTANVLSEFLKNYGKEYEPMANYLYFIASAYWAVSGKFEEWLAIYPDKHKAVCSYPIGISRKIFYYLLVKRRFIICEIIRKYTKG